MTAPKITKTGNSSTTVRTDNATLYYSYQTVIAFYTDATGLVVSENCWNVTTGKHLNAIDGGNKKARLPRAEFEKRLAEIA
jgi:hypothetical protein